MLDVNRMEFPEPVIELAIESKAKADQAKMGTGIARLVAEDPSLRFRTDEESGKTVIAGMDELHLEIIVDRLKREFQVEFNVGVPQIVYRETFSEPVELVYTHKKQSGGAGQFAEVKIKFEPQEAGEGFEFINSIVGGAIPDEYIPCVQKGIERAMLNGTIAGFPVVDIKAELVDGKYDDLYSNIYTFELAARGAFREAMEKSSPKLLEPIMEVEIITPEDYMEYVIRDVNSRRGIIQGTENRGNAVVVNAHVPLSSMLGYINDLRSATYGKAQFSMEFSYYAPVPSNIIYEIKEALLRK